MKFIKFFSAGKDYIYLDSDIAFEEINSLDIKLLCDRLQGVGADGIFALHQNSAKNSQIIGFSKNGEIMRDYSTASVCAAFAVNSQKSFNEHVFTCKNNEIFTLFSDSGGKNPLISCDLSNGNFNTVFPAINRKTELGNRILTLTALELHGIHTVHFSECKDKLDIDYLGKKLSENSLFRKQADLIIAQKSERNCFDISYYENRTGNPRPTVASFAAAALAACKTDNAKYREEIRITCNKNPVYVFCNENDNAVVQCSVQKVFEGNI